MEYINERRVHCRKSKTFRMTLCHQCESKIKKRGIYTCGGWECITDEVMGGTSAIKECDARNNILTVSGCVKNFGESSGFILIKNKINAPVDVANIEFEIKEREAQGMNNDVSVLIFPENCKFNSTTTLDNARLLVSKLFTGSQCPAWYSHKIDKCGRQSIALANFSYQFMATENLSQKYEKEKLEYVGFLFRKCGDFSFDISNVNFK